MTLFPEEEVSHFRGECGYGFGPIKNDEQLACLIFDDWLDENGDFTARAFAVKQLRKCNVSLARVLYTSCSDVNEKVIAPRIANGGVFRYLVVALTKELRHISAVDPVTATNLGRGIIVLDQVEPADYNGHSAIGFSVNVGGQGSDRHLSAVRQAVRLDILRAFEQREAITYLQVLRRG